MELTLAQADLAYALQTALASVPSKSTLPILQSVLLETSDGHLRLTGTDLARKLRERRADLPIVLVSGYIGPMMTERAVAAGVDEILKKPVHSRELAAALARVLSAVTDPRPRRGK